MITDNHDIDWRLEYVYKINKQKSIDKILLND